MKKIFFAALMLLSASSVMAQIQFESGSLKDALAKAKAENKLVMAIGSATWCAPCQGAAKNIYPLTEVGDFMNDKFVNLKYELDKADPDKIKDTYGLNVYPTYYFIDSEGKEVARMTGGSKDGKDFIKRVTEATAKENQWNARNERFKNDPSYAVAHIKHLQTVSLKKEAEAALNELFAKRSLNDNFDKESLDLYKSVIKSENDPIVKTMLDKKKEVSTIMGKKEYSDFLKDVMTNVVFNNGSFTKSETMDKQIAFVNANPDMKSGMAEFLSVAKDDILAKNAPVLAAKAIKLNKKFTPMERDMITWYLTRSLKKDDSKEDIITFVQGAIKSEPNKEKADNLSKTLESLSK